MISLEIKSSDKFATPKPGTVVLKTCNRSEIYSGSGDIPIDIVRHLFRITTGLESNLVGENAIQGQVKEAYNRAKENNISSSLHKLFQKALYVGKKVRTETGINRGAVSHSQAAVDLLLKLNLDLENAFITLIGAHNMNDKIIYHLARKGAKTVFLGNRTFNKAKEIAKKYNSGVFHLDSLTSILNKTDILISATSAPHSIINSSNFPKGRQMTIVDLAIPQDISKEIINLDGIKYYNNSGVEDRVNQNLSLRKKEITLASIIVDNEVNDFLKKIKDDKERSR